MSHIAYVNGRYVHHAQAQVHVEDRGYQFADGVYEYIAFYNRLMLDGDAHLARLARSLKELGMEAPMSTAAMKLVIGELIERNGRENGGIYMQVTRGVSRRDHPFPKSVKPALVMTICAPKYPKPAEIKEGVKVITYPENRWHRRDIKSVSLLANVLAKQEATRRQCREAWLIEDGHVNEGAVSNAYIVSKDGTIITHQADEHILGGITRDSLLKLARSAQIPVEERSFSTQEMGEAAEAFITSTSANVLPVVQIDDNKVGNGKPGPVTRRLQELYTDYIFEQTGRRLA